MTSYQLDTVPDLHQPVAILAFAGWNDAASAATNAARFIVRRLGARRFATLDAEPFYSFTDTRPSVRASPSGTRVLQWPQNEFFYARNPTGPHDVVVCIGTEPNLRWPTFAQAHADVLGQLNVETVITLGALLADVPHTRPTKVNGRSNDPELAERLNLEPSRYEGPTGIIGVLHGAFEAASLPAMSLWANVPHYITASQNPPATVALLERLETILQVPFDYSDLREAGERFQREVSTALGTNAEVLDYVNRLEEAYDNGEDQSGGIQDASTGDILRDVEDWLRQQRDDE